MENKIYFKMCNNGQISIDEIKEKIKNTKLHVLTFATHEQGYFKTLKESCKNLNINLKVLGMGEKWKGFIWKLIKVKEYLNLCDDNDLILFVDGFDTFFVQPANVIIERYIINYDNFFVCTSESTLSTNSRFLKFIEKMHLIFHDSIFKNNDNTDWDSLNIKKKYENFTFFYNNLNLLNSGGWISNVFLAKKILQYIPSFIDNDQVFLTNLYLDSNYILKLKGKISSRDSKKILECDILKNIEYYNKIIIDNHNIIFHLFRGKNDLILLNYADCIKYFPYKPLLNIYYLNDEKKEKIIYENSLKPKKKKKNFINTIINYIKELFIKNKKDINCDNNDDDLKKIMLVIMLVKEKYKNKNEWRKQKSFLDNVYIDNIRKIGQIEKTFNYSVVDVYTCSSPCILHIHCLRNVDDIILNIGLKNIYNSKWYGHIWYLFYSLKDTLNFNYFSLLFSTVVAFVTFILIYLKYLLNFLIYIDTNFYINNIKKITYVNKTMLLLNDIEISCFLSFILSFLFWIFYIFNKAII
ncbi:procollagen lysine 5-dioxygenase, putative [Plasmodium gallinaceum]|uniref:Procollagen lysine 5-dioxygenase, putative n=1 Tax=Plasmodium gallinaceum TaxID=5849 RepID=A0A1J1GWJ9_PLAGA|nr:procollagen lysine 5-dioxygenase, putative [Plasmodium gallinaceum]CRG96847.1 procollagen lysine 5-dioxygenase, putative [Plasmodium gallinaceum]